MDVENGAYQWGTKSSRPSGRSGGTAHFRSNLMTMIGVYRSLIFLNFASFVFSRTSETREGPETVHLVPEKCAYTYMNGLEFSTPNPRQTRLNEVLILRQKNDIVHKIGL